MLLTIVKIRSPTGGKQPIDKAFANDACIEMVSLKLSAWVSSPLSFFHLNINGVNPDTSRSCGYDLIAFAVSLRLPLVIMLAMFTKVDRITGAKYMGNLISISKMGYIDEGRGSNEAV